MLGNSIEHSKQQLLVTLGNFVSMNSIAPCFSAILWGWNPKQIFWRDNMTVKALLNTKQNERSATYILKACWCCACFQLELKARIVQHIYIRNIVMEHDLHNTFTTRFWEKSANRNQGLHLLNFPYGNSIKMLCSKWWPRKCSPDSAHPHDHHTRTNTCRTWKYNIHIYEWHVTCT